MEKIKLTEQQIKDYMNKTFQDPNIQHQFLAYNTT